MSILYFECSVVDYFSLETVLINNFSDVNLVCEPKPHQIGRKRQNLSKTGNDW